MSSFATGGSPLPRSASLVPTLLAIGIALGITMSCGGGDSGPVDTGPIPVPVCFYDAAESSLNLENNSQIVTRRVPATGLIVNGISMGNANCTAAPSTATFGGNGYIESIIHEASPFADNTGSFVVFAIPRDLQDKGFLELLEDQGVFRGWAPGSGIKYRSTMSNDVPELERRFQEVWQELQPIDLDPYNEDGSIVSFREGAVPGGGTVVLQRGSWSFSGVGIPRTGGTLDYRPAAPDFDERLLHAVSRSIGLARADPSSSGGFGRAGAQEFTEDEIRSLRVATNLAGLSAPD